MGARRQQRALQSQAPLACWRERLLNGRDPELAALHLRRAARQRKAIDLLLETARTPGIALTIIGDGALREELQTRFAGTGTHFTGYLYGDDLADAYASADAFMFTGANETFGQVVQEAMASGLPAIIIDQGGITDQVDARRQWFHLPRRSAALSPPPPAVCATIPTGAVQHVRQRPPLRRAASLGSAHGELETHYAEAVRLNRALRPAVPAGFALESS